MSVLTSIIVDTVIALSNESALLFTSASLAENRAFPMQKRDVYQTTKTLMTV